MGKSSSKYLNLVTWTFTTAPPSFTQHSLKMMHCHMFGCKMISASNGVQTNTKPPIKASKGGNDRFKQLCTLGY